MYVSKVFKRTVLIKIIKWSGYKSVTVRSPPPAQEKRDQKSRKVNQHVQQTRRTVWEAFGFVEGNVASVALLSISRSKKSTKDPRGHGGLPVLRSGRGALPLNSYFSLFISTSRTTRCFLQQLFATYNNLVSKHLSFVGIKTLNNLNAFELVFQQCCKTSCACLFAVLPVLVHVAGWTICP